jgi:hypothetical protein
MKQFVNPHQPSSQLETKSWMRATADKLSKDLSPEHHAHAKAIEEVLAKNSYFVDHFN